MENIVQEFEAIQRSNSIASPISNNSRNDRGVGGRNSWTDFFLPCQTILVFDWDDTLCPTHWIRSDSQLSANKKVPKCPNVQRKLRTHDKEVRKLLKTAKKLGKVVLVTNAKRPWVSTTIKHFMPNLQDCTSDIPIVYAQEYFEKLRAEGFDMTSNCILTAFKTMAMKEAVGEFYSQYADQSWKNMVSIGDGFFEHDAIEEVRTFRPHQEPDSPKSRCRVKRIKLMDEPTVEGLTVQVSLLRCWLLDIVSADGDIDMDLNSEDSIEKWNTEFSKGNSPTFSKTLSMSSVSSLESYDSLNTYESMSAGEEAGAPEDASTEFLDESILDESIRGFLKYDSEKIWLQPAVCAIPAKRNHGPATAETTSVSSLMQKRSLKLQPLDPKTCA